MNNANDVCIWSHQTQSTLLLNNISAPHNILPKKCLHHYWQPRTARSLHVIVILYQVVSCWVISWEQTKLTIICPAELSLPCGGMFYIRCWLMYIALQHAVYHQKQWSNNSLGGVEFLLPCHAIAMQSIDHTTRPANWQYPQDIHDHPKKHHA